MRDQNNLLYNYKINFIHLTICLYDIYDCPSQVTYEVIYQSMCDISRLQEQILSSQITRPKLSE